MKSKRIVKVVCVVVCVLILLAVLFNGTGGMEFVIAPKNWGFSVRRLEIYNIPKTNGITESFTNRVSHVGPVIFTEYNR